MDDRRRSDRIPIRVEVACRVKGREGPATVYDVSVDGCMLETSPGFTSEGDTIVIKFRSELHVPGTVIWVKERNAGVQFADRMHPATMEHLGFASPVADLHPMEMRDHFGRAMPGLRGTIRPRFI